jgi:hypothetical protein
MKIMLAFSSIVCGIVIAATWHWLSVPEILNKQDVAIVLGFAVAGLIGNIINIALDL